METEIEIEVKILRGESREIELQLILNTMIIFCERRCRRTHRQTDGHTQTDKQTDEMT